MGISHKISSEEIFQTVEDVKKDITSKIASKIMELNGGSSVSAVFVVGGGGKLTGFTDYLAKALKLPPERVALRGQEVMGDINFLVDNVKKDSLYVTPVGICLNYFDQKNNFIFVTVNGQRVKLYNNDKLTIFDAAHACGFSNEQIFPKRGADITFKINGKTRIVRGFTGEAAQITQNGVSVGMNSLIEANDKIEIIESTSGKEAELALNSLPEYNGTLDFVVNDVCITCPKFAMVNSEPESQFYMIQDGDDIVMQNFYTLEQLLTFMDINPVGIVYVNNKKAAPDEKIYDNFVVTWKDDVSFEDLQEDEPAAGQEQTVDVLSVEAPVSNEEKINADSDSPKKIKVTINGIPYVMTGKSEYKFVDILDYYQFDLSAMGGKSLATNINSQHAEFVSALNDGDSVEIYWVK